MSFFDHHLQLRVKEIPAYIKDSNNLVNKINESKIPKNSFLVTMDVKSSYANIHNNEGIAFVNRKHGNYAIKNRSHQSDNKVLSPYFDTNQFHFLLKVLPSNKRLSHGNNICPYIHKHIYV